MEEMVKKGSLQHTCIVPTIFLEIKIDSVYLNIYLFQTS